MTTRLEKRRALVKNAMPEVKKLVAKYDRAAIQNCLNQLRDYEKTVKELERAEAKAAELRRKVGK